MPSITVDVVLLRDDEVLLTMREDLEVWCLPGGHVDPGESVHDAALRELREETGYECELGPLVGVYSAVGDWPDLHACVFTGSPGGQGALATPDEVLDLAWFPVRDLPADLLWWHRDRIVDAVAGRTGLVVTQRIMTTLGRLDRAGLYAARDASGLPRSEFYRRTFRER